MGAAIAAAAIAAIGIGAGAYGASKQGDAASANRSVLQSLLNTPRIDLGNTELSSLSRMYAEQPLATNLSRTGANADLSTLLGLQERITPGIGNTRGMMLGDINSLLSGNMFQKDNMASGNAWGIGSGFGGSEFGLLNSMTHSSQLRMAQLGAVPGLLGSLMGASPQPNVPGTFSYGPLSPQQSVQAEIAQRGQMFGVGSQLGSSPGPGNAWGSFLGGAGGTATGIGTLYGLSALQQSGSGGGNSFGLVN